MADVYFNSIMTGCGIVSFNGAASNTPEDIIESFVKCQAGNGNIYDVAAGKYVPASNLRFSSCFVVWSDFDRTTCADQCSPTKPEVEAPYSGAKFAAFIRDNKLGEVVESPGRHNPLHGERILKDKNGKPTGEVVGLLHVYIWAIDPIALGEWHTAYKARAEEAERERQAQLKKGVHLGDEVKKAVNG